MTKSLKSEAGARFTRETRAGGTLNAEMAGRFSKVARLAL